MASRLASGFTRAAGLDELAVDDIEQYERKAVQLAQHPDALRRLKEFLARQLPGCALFDTATRVRALQRAFAAMVERQRAGLPPDTLIID